MRSVHVKNVPFAVLICTLVSSFLTPERCGAQVLYGSVVGLVADQSGAAVPGAAVRLNSQETGAVREVASDSEGRFTVPNVLPGRYTVSVSSPNFKAIRRTDVAITINTVTRIDFTLELGSVADSVTVSGAAAVLQTDKADVRNELPAAVLTNLPLSSYRNYQTFINLTPGATPGAFQNAITDTPQRSLTTNINGVFRNFNTTRVDGVANLSPSLPHHNAYVPPVEAIEAVNITTASFDAEQGMAAGAAVTLTTKSGTNAFHGVAFWYHDDQHLRARNYFLRRPQKPRSGNNFPGATFGGPVVRNKLFFFTSWEGTHERSGQVANLSVPTAQQRVGDFGGLPATIYDPATGNPDGSGRLPFSGNVVPAGRMSSITQKILAAVPLPNLPGTLTNFTNAGTQRLDRNNYDGKVNWNRTDAHSIGGKYSRMDARVQCDYALGLAGGPGLCSDGVGTADTVVNIANFGHNWSLRPTLLLDSTFGFTRLDTTGTSSDYGTHYGRDVWGIPGTNGTDIRYSGLPIIRTDYGDWGNPYPWLPMWRNDRSYTFSANVSKISGAHELRFGFDLIRLSLNVWQPNVGANGPRGLMSFGGGVTSLNGGAAPNYLNSFATFLLGLQSTAGKSVQNYPLQTSREWQFGWYARDRWQITRKLTVNLGLRYEYYPLMSRSDRGVERWDPTTNLVYLGGIGNTPRNAGIEVSKTLFAPRVGLSWRVGNGTVIRSGYGINIDPSSLARPFRSLYPSVVEATYNGPTSFLAFRPIEQGIPAIPIPDITSGVVSLPSTVSMSRDSAWGGMLHRGYIQSWNFTVERQLSASMLATVAYVGTQTTRSLADRDINAAAPGAGQNGRPLVRTIGRTVDSFMYDGWLSANYHSFQATLNHHFSRGLLVKAAYTWSKAIDMSDEGQWGSVMWNWGPVIGRNRARSGFDRTHMLVAGAVWELPFGSGKPLASRGWFSKVAGGWQTNAMFSAYTGTPFTVTASGASLNAPGNAQTADQVKPVVEKLGKIGPGEAFYDPLAFRAVSDVRFGSTGRNILTGPGKVNLDLSLIRSFPLTEKMKLEFKAESFNFTNTPHFNNPGANVSNMSLNSDGTIRSLGNFLSVTSAQNDERQFRFGLRLSF